MTLSVKNLLRLRGVLLAAVMLALPGRGWATDSITNTYGYFNGSNNVPVIDAVTWVNDGIIDDILTTYPFDTTSTVYFTNRGDITGQVGFRFDTVNEVLGTRRPMSTFYNRGNIVALDSPLQFFNPFFGQNGILGFGGITGTSASWLLVDSTNIVNVNSGTLAVGNVGLMRLNGKDIDLTRGTLIAGDVANLNTNAVVSSANFFNVLGSSTGQGLISYFASQYVNPPQVYDLYWGSTLSGTQPLAPLAAPLPFSPSYKPDFVTFRANGNFTTFGFNLPVTFPADFDAAEFAYVNTGPSDIGGRPVQFGGVGDLTNYFFNFIFFKTNVSDPAITVTPRFSFATDYPVAGNAVNGGSEAMVEFGVLTNDVATGLPVTNAFYLLDNGFYQQSITVFTNASDQNKNGRPSNFQITTATPFEWVVGDTNTDPFMAQYYLPYNVDDIYPGTFQVQGTYPAKPVDYTSGSYGVQVGRQPEFLNGVTAVSNIFTVSGFSNLLVLADPTNEAPRIEINATNLDLTSAYIRSEGVLNINTKHLIPGSPAGLDVGILNGDIASTNGLLQISNVVSPAFRRVRGDVFAWSGNFNFTATNDVKTNAVHVHILVVDHALTANFTPTFRNLALRAPATVVNDNVRVIKSSLFQAQQLTFNSSVTLAQDAGTFGHQNAPILNDFLIDTNGAFNVERVAYIGGDTTKGINSFINRGLFTSMAALIKANYVENSGSILATNGSSIVIEADTVNLIPSTSPTPLFPNTLMATRDVTITANDVTAIGSAIVAGMNGSLGTLHITADNSFTDNVPGVAGTTDVITNVWQTSDGIIVDRTPQNFGVVNDLFGTEIICTTSNRNQAQIVWPAQDVGAGSDGFFNNLVVGRLVLDRQTPNSSIRFSAAGGQNAIYVDYLELRDFSFSDYRNGLIIDPNMTVYFAASNFEPDKLAAVFPGRLVWANSFAGPNSTKAVARRDGTTCLMNRSLADSQIIDLDNDGIVNASDPFPLDNDSNPAFSLPCPGDTLTTSIRTFLTDNHGSGPMTSLAVSVTGSGKITPQQKSPVVQLGTTYNLHAVANPGNLFAGWSGSINTTQPNISFTLTSNMVLNARFVTNPFVGLRGSFNGLFYDTNNVTIENAGSITVSVTQQGGFSGHLGMTSGVVPFRGQFDADGNATVLASRGKKTPLTLALKLDTTGASQQITGTVTCDTNWTAPMIADRAVFGGRDVAPFTGNYTFAWQGTNAPGAGPAGDSYGTAFISRVGTLVSVIRLADNNTIHQVVPVSKDGNWPLFGSLSGKEMLIGWVHIDGAGVMSGTVNWVKSAVSYGYYRAGFSNAVPVNGSIWVAPKNRTTGLNLTTPVVTLTGGNLVSDLVPVTTFNPNNLTFSSTNPSLSLKLVPSLGLFNGRFTDPTSNRVRQFSGVMLQNQNDARGFFLGIDQSGAVRLDNP